MSEKVGKIEIVIKGGQPWGFRLQAKAENRSVVIVDEIVRGGRADQQGELKVGDHVIKINGIQCLSLADALQLIDSAFRTLTIVVWRTSNFLSKDNPKDFDAVHQFDQLPKYASYQSDSNLETPAIYENINFRFQEGKQRDRRFLPVENGHHISNKESSAISSQQLPYNNSKVYSGRIDYYKNNLKTPYSCLDKTFKNEPEKKAMSVYNPERKLHSKTQRDLHQYSNVQPLPALNYMPEINKYERRHFSRTPKEIRQYSNVHSINDSTHGKKFNLSESSDQTPVPSSPVHENNHQVINNNLGQYPVHNMLTNTKVSNESHCCRYPNCHNTYLNCKIHSPPERDVTYPVRQSFQNDYENIDFISQPNFAYKDQSNCDSLSYEQKADSTLNYVPYGNKKKVTDSKTMKWERDPVPSNPCTFPVIRSSTKPFNSKLEDSVSVAIPRAMSDTHGKSQGGNLVNSSLKWEKDSVPTNPHDFPVTRSSTSPSNYKSEESLNNIVPQTTSDIQGRSHGGNSFMKWEKDSVPTSSCDFPVIRSSTSPSNYKSEDSVKKIIPNTTSDTRKSVGGNSVLTLCHFPSSVYEEKVNLQSVNDNSTAQSIQDLDNFQSKTLNNQNLPMPYNEQGKELVNKYLYSNPCDVPVIKSSSNAFNYKLVESVNNSIPQTSSDTHRKSVDGNSVSLSHFSNGIYEGKVNSQSKADDSSFQSNRDYNVYQYKTFHRQIQPLSYSLQGKESPNESLYSNLSDVPGIKSSTNASNYQFEESVSHVPKTNSDTPGKLVGGNPVSLSPSSNNVYEGELNSQSKADDSTSQSNRDSDIYQYKTYGQIQPLSHSLQGKESPSESLYTNSSDVPVIKSSTYASNYQFEESVRNVLKTNSDTQGKSVGGSPVSLSPSSNNVYEGKLNSQSKADDSTSQSNRDSDIYQHKTYGQIQPLSYSLQGKESPSESLYSNSSDVPVIKSSTNVSNYHFEEFVNSIPKTNSDAQGKSVSGNPVSMSPSSNNVYEGKFNSQNKANNSTSQSNRDSNIYQYKTVYGQIQPLSYSLHGKESPSESVYSNSSDVPVIKSSTNASNYHFEESVSNVPKINSDTHTNSVGGDSMSSLCHVSNSIYEQKVNSQSKADDLTFQPIKDSDIFQYKSVYGQIKPMSYSLEGKESASKSLNSSCSKPSFNKRMFSSLNNASFIKENVFFDASNNSMCMISKEAAVVKLVSSRPQQIYMDEDDELKAIDENRNKTAASFLPISSSPPLPSPPPENNLEILPCYEPLPSPPLFVSEQKQNNTNEVVETIYANLEMLKIQYSVVSSSSQTSASNEKQSMTFSNSIGDIASNVSSAESVSLPVTSEFVEAKPQVDASFLGKVFQNQEEKMWRRVLNLPFNSAYFTTSVPKAKLLTRYTSKLQPNSMTEVKELSNEKEELTASLRKKLDILLEEEAAVQEELQQNEELGNSLSNKLESAATQNELKKFSNHVQELEKITNLLLSLSGRLARTKNALLILPSNASAEEKVLLETKYKKLTQQYEEALHLQKDIDNRNKQVLFYLQKYFTKDELADYNHFIKMKVKLLVDYKELVEKIKLGEEQLKALTSS